VNALIEEPRVDSDRVARVSPAFLSGESEPAAHCRSLATVLAARWGMDAAVAGLDEQRHARSCLLAGVDTGTAAVGLRLAIAFAQAGRATTLIDVTETGRGCDRFVEVPPALTSSDVSNDGAFSPIYATNVPNLGLVPAGSSEASGGDLQLADRVARLLQRTPTVEQGVAIVVAPALSVAPSALALARLVGGVLLAVTPGRTTRPDAVRARDALYAAGGRIWGVILAADERGSGAGATSER